MTFWRTTHVVLAWATVFATGLAGLWCLWSARSRSSASAVAKTAKAALLWVAFGGVFVQLSVGAALVGTSGVEAPAFHVFYGVCAALAIAVLYGYRHQLGARRDLMFGLGSLFVMGLLIRAHFLG